MSLQFRLEAFAEAVGTDIKELRESPYTAEPALDVFMLAGQSNMAGNAGPPDQDLDPPHSNVFAWNVTGPTPSRITQATEPMRGPNVNNVQLGPGLAFARYYAQAFPNRRVLLVPTAWSGQAVVGGTWDPDTPGARFSGAIQIFNSAMAAAGPDANFAGILWIQGESDGDNNTTQAAYSAKLLTLIDAFRSRLRGASEATPFVMVGMVPEYQDIGTRIQIRAAQFAAQNQRAYVSYTAGPSGMNMMDNNHYSADGERENGKRLYEGLVTARTYMVPQSLTDPNPTGDPFVSNGNIYDNFTRSNNPEYLGRAPTGQSWVWSGAQWGVISNQAYPSTAPTNGIAVLNALRSDGTAKVVFASVPSTTGVYPRFIFRSDGYLNYWMVQWRPGTGWQFFKCINGAFTQVGTSLATPTVVNGDSIDAVLSGSSITVRRNGANLFTTTDTFQQNGTFHGFGAQGTGAEACRFDSFTFS